LLSFKKIQNKGYVQASAFVNGGGASAARLRLLII
jgi:hypothetical protein